MGVIMFEWLRKRSLRSRILVYAGAAILAFALAAGMGALATLMLRGEVGLLDGGEPRPAGKQNDARAQQKDVVPRHPQQDEAKYVRTVGDIQARAVETFLEGHDKVLRYDTLTANDVAEMQANEAALEEMTGEISELVPPRKYEGQYQAFSSAVDKLHEAARLAYSLAADPVAATESGFDEYDSRVKEAATLLQRSNEMLGRDFETIEDVREISPELGRPKS
jgi:hypothetical protein